MMVTRVFFADGTQEREEWPQGASPATALRLAVVEAEFARQGAPHTGAWLEFEPDSTNPATA